MNPRTNRNNRYVHHDDDDDDDDEDFSSYEEESGAEDLQQHDGPRTGGAQNAVSFFQNSSRFEINGGDFSAVGGDVYAGSPPLPVGSSPSAIPYRPGTRPLQTPTVSFFKGASDFKINKGTFQAIGGNRFGHSSGSQSSSPSPLHGTPPGAGGLRPQTNPSFRRSESPIPPHTAASGASGAVRPSATAQRVPDNGTRPQFTQAKGSHSSAWKNNSLSSPTTTLSNGSLPQISQERATRSPSSGMSVPEALDEFSMDVVEDSLEDRRHSTSSLTYNRHPGLASGDFNGQIATSTTAIGAIHGGASTSSAPNMSTATGVPIPLQNNTMRADAGSSFSEDDINPPTVLGPGPNRDSSSQAFDTQQGDNTHLNASTENQDISASTGRAQGKRKGPMHKIWKKVAKGKVK